MMKKTCKRCRGQRWVCEKHSHMEWPSERGIPHDDCLGPGEPCPECNMGVVPEMPPGTRILVQHDKEETS